jgi:hypothetical protein
VKLDNAPVEFHIQSRPWDGYLDNVRVRPFIRRSFNAGIASRQNLSSKLLNKSAGGR